MAVALVAVSTSGPLMAAAAAPALAIAFWRNALGTAAITPFALARHRDELARLDRREWAVALLAGAMLAAHFATWVPALTLTSVASATALVSTQPVFTALLARAGGLVVPGQAWLGMGIALVGVLVITGVDLSLSTRSLVGDLLALLGGFFAAAYVTAGAQVRRSVSTTSYTFVCYGFCAGLLLAGCLLGRVQLVGFSGRTWVELVALTLGAQLLGHSLFNVVLRTTSAMVVSLVLLFETPGAALIAALWLHQVPPWGVLPAAALLLLGVAVVIRSGSAAPVEAP
jgi:drug/metabolite transporter (DMT)-like permease